VIWVLGRTSETMLVIDRAVFLYHQKLKTTKLKALTTVKQKTHEKF